MAFQIKQLDSNSHSIAKQWDNYVDQHEQGSFFHLSKWQDVIALACGHKGHYIYACDDNSEIVGVLPLVHCKSLLFGNALVSTPFCVYGGAIANNSEILSALEIHAQQLADTLKVDYLELRYQQPREFSAEQQSHWHEKSAHAYFGCDLADTPEEILANVKKKQRAVIRQSKASELDVAFDDNVNRFFNIYSQSVRNLGTPVFSKKYFKLLQQYFPEQCELLTIEKDGEPVSSVMSFYYKQQVLPYYGGGAYQARALKSNDFMYYELMCHASENKHCNYFDFGRSKVDSGAYKYKKHWGMEPKPLHYYYYLVKADAVPNLSPNNPKYQMFIKAWQKLPLAVSQFIGPFLAKNLG
ncbi:FemAB family XrtA/PEP-CTERM system-associated protein [Flocculibacter collagenilyticus]|uniref:FemAB family XrtA/PEP-CTERM system-associated protein n=1 Tax=Flocculibacter collagenilyticus TaxID=2744479 RepID=UPI001F3D781F|nr:FemAB family XrtA/PEP-CTERM system-associated protein [Flocculibacter collagenilyticus]